MAGNINMQRVADAAGVSKSSVSLALRDDPRLAPATRRRVQEAAARLGYRKNPVVASLMAQLRVSQTPKFQANVALLNCSPQRHVYDDVRHEEIRRGIVARLDQAGYGIDDFWTGEATLKPGRLRQILEARGVRGIVLFATMDTEVIFPADSQIFDGFCVAVAGLNRAPIALHRATNNDFQTARSALGAAIEHGFIRPGLVLDNRVDRALERRYSAGFFAALQDAPIALSSRTRPLQMESPNRDDFVRWYMAEQPDVIITDRTEVMKWAGSMELRVPDDVGLIHLDLGPDIKGWAGMRHNRSLIGAAAADLVLSQLSKNETGPREHPTLVSIESTFVSGPSCLRAAKCAV